MYKLITKFFYRFKGIRRIAKKLLENRVIAQPFFTGKIYFNAVEYSFFWLQGTLCQNIDRDIQDALLSLSRHNEYFIDIGANIGIMTLSVAMRNKDIKVVAYDPNQHILNYLNKSVIKNNLSGRVKTISSAVSDKSGKAIMNFSTGPYSGHLVNDGVQGTEVDIIDFGSLLQEFKEKKTFFKLDIEGYETIVVPVIVKNKNPNHSFVIEIHPKGLNGISDPDFVLQQLFSNEYTVTDISGKKVNSKEDIIDWGNVVCYYEKKVDTI